MGRREVVVLVYGWEWEVVRGREEEGGRGREGEGGER